MTDEIENELFQKGILIVPDFVANAGGVVSSYAEYRGYTQEKAFELLEEKAKETTTLVLTKSIKENINPRDVGIQIAKERIEAKQKDLDLKTKEIKGAESRLRQRVR